MRKKLESLNASLVRLAHHYREPSSLLEAARRENPDASKKEIIHAALLSMIEQVETDELAARRLHKMAMKNRSEDLEP